MLTLLDRYILRRFVFAYLGTFTSLMLMYITIDVFSKFEEFTTVDPAKLAIKIRKAEAAGTSGGTTTAVQQMSKVETGEKLKVFFHNVYIYYKYRLPVFFQRVNGIMLLLAGAFTLGWMERQNELVPILSAGIPLRRLLIPLSGVTCVFLLLQWLDTEFVIPHCADHLLRIAEDPLGKRPLLVPGTFDMNHVHIEARVAYPQRQMIQHARVTIPAELMGNTLHVHSKEMFYQPGNSADDHGWIMNGCTPTLVPAIYPGLKQLAPGQFFLKTELSYHRLTRRPNWYLYVSTWELFDIIENEQSIAQRSAIIGQLHQRLLAPFYDILLLCLGLPIIAGRSEWNLVIRVGWCLLIFVLIQAVCMGCGMLVKSDSLDPALAGWLPLLLLGPLVPAVVSSMRT